jgi:hypothetical protein
VLEHTPGGLTIPVRQTPSTEWPHKRRKSRQGEILLKCVVSYRRQ